MERRKKSMRNGFVSLVRTQRENRGIPSRFCLSSLAPDESPRFSL